MQIYLVQKRERKKRPPNPIFQGPVTPIHFFLFFFCLITHFFILFSHIKNQYIHALGIVWVYDLLFLCTMTHIIWKIFLFAFVSYEVVGLMKETCIVTGADPGVSFRGGAKDYMCMYAHHEHEAQSPLQPGSMGPLKGLQALGFLILSRAIWALSVSIPIQNGITNNLLIKI